MAAMEVTYSHVFILWMVLVSIRSNTILDCVYDTVTTDIFSTVTSLDVTSSYHLYYLSQSVTWCQAYHFCDRRGRHLASIKDNAAQTTIQQTLSRIGLASNIWLGGRRKDFGHDWTWANRSLTDQPVNYLIYHLPIDGSPGGTIFTRTENDSLLRFGNYAANRCLCTAADGISRKEKDMSAFRGRSWFDAQNLCVSKGGRLSTLDEVIASESGKNIANEYWIGIYRNAWIWVQGAERAQMSPVLFSLWTADVESGKILASGSCMVMDPQHNAQNITGAWKGIPCETKLNSVMCEESGIKPLITPAIPSDGTDIGAGSGPGPKTEPGPSPGRRPGTGGPQPEYVPDTDKSYVVAISAGVSLLVLGVIVIITSVLVCKRKKKNTYRKRSDQTQSDVTASRPEQLEGRTTPSSRAPLPQIPTPRVCMSTSVQSQHQRIEDESQADHYDQIDDLMISRVCTRASKEYTYITTPYDNENVASTPGEAIAESYITAPGEAISESYITAPGEAMIPDSYITAPGDLTPDYDDVAHGRVYYQNDALNPKRVHIAVKTKPSGVKGKQYEKLIAPEKYCNVVMQ